MFVAAVVELVLPPLPPPKLSASTAVPGTRSNGSVAPLADGTPVSKRPSRPTRSAARLRVNRDICFPPVPAERPRARRPLVQFDLDVSHPHRRARTRQRRHEDHQGASPDFAEQRPSEQLRQNASSPIPPARKRLALRRRTAPCDGTRRLTSQSRSAPCSRRTTGSGPGGGFGRR